MKKYSIENRALRHFGKTEVYQFAGYILADGTMLNFSYEGNQRDCDHRDIGDFFSKSCGTEAMLKFMRRGNIRVCCNENNYCFEYIRPLTDAQKRQIRDAYKESRDCYGTFYLEKDDEKGNAKRYWNNAYCLEEY